MVRRKNYLLNPVSRQNFANALAENHNLKLEVCRMQLKLTMSEVVKSTYFESNGDIWKVDDSGPTTGDTGTERHERRRPPSLKLAALVQFPPAAVEIVLKIALN